MSAPAARGVQRSLPVIRVDLDTAYIDGGMNNVVKWSRRAYKSAESGISIKVVAAKERVLDAIRDMDGGGGYGMSKLDIHANALTLGMKMDKILNRLKELIILVIPQEKDKLTKYTTNHPSGAYSDQYRNQLRHVVMKLWDIVEKHTTAKEDQSWGQTLVALYNEFADLYVSWHPQPSPTPGTGAPCLIPMALYHPVLLLRLP